MWTSTMASELANETDHPLIHPPQTDGATIPQDTVQKVVFVFAVMIIPVSVFGCVGNVLSLSVLVHHRMRSTTNYCLAALAISDFLVLLHSLWYASLIVYKSRDPLAATNLRRLTYPVIGAYGSVATARITTWLTTLLSVERFIAVYCPLKARRICSKRHTCLGIGIIYFVTIVFLVPLALKYRPVTVTRNNQTVVLLEKTALGKNKSFSVVYGTVLNVLFRFVPITLLIILNVLIVKAIKRIWQLRRLLSKSGNNCNMSEQNRITVMLLVVSSAFLLGVMPGALNSIVSQVRPAYSHLGSDRATYAIASSVTYFMEVGNSSINFIIYIAFSAKFCNTYQEMFCCRRPAVTAAALAARSSSRGVVRFSKRSVSSINTREFRLSAILVEQGKTNFKRTVSATSSFDLENAKLLGQRGKQVSVDSESGGQVFKPR